MRHCTDIFVVYKQNSCQCECQGPMANKMLNIFMNHESNVQTDEYLLGILELRWIN